MKLILFLQRSKAAVINTLKCPHIIRFAGKPHPELSVSSPILPHSLSDQKDGVSGRQVYDAPKLTPRSQQTKHINEETNARRQKRLAISAAFLAREAKEEAERKAKLYAKLVAWRQERGRLSPPCLKRKRDDDPGKPSRCIRLLPASGNGMLQHPYNTAAPEFVMGLE